MSAQFQPFDSAYWMQNPAHFGSQPAFNNGISDEYSLNQAAPRQWQFVEQDNNNNYTGQFYINQPTPPPHLSTPQRRALSNSTNSTTASYASLRSPYSAGTHLPYQPNFEQPAFYDSTFEGYPVSQQQHQFYKPHHHLPTPVHTPTQEFYMADGRIVSRRRSGMESADSVQAAHKALRPLLTGHSSSIGDFAPEIPATPRGTSQGEGDEQLGVPQSSASRRVPSFDRTMSDIYQDELYNPNNAPVAPAPSKGNTSALLSPYRTIVNDRLQAANEARSTESPQSASRATSPFRQGSPFAPALHGYGPIGSAAAARQRQKAEADALAYQQHHARMEDTTPNTISPKDAVLEYNEYEEQGPPLFPASTNVSESSTFEPMPMYGPIGVKGGKPTNSNSNSFAYPAAPASANPEYSRQNMPYMPPPAQFRAINTSASSSQHDPQDYPTHLVSMETSRSEADSDSPTYDTHSEKQVEYAKPQGTNADSGSYTCPYSGCTKRFASGALLQKHKRDDHRAAGSATSSSQPATMSTPHTTSASTSPTPASSTTPTTSGIGAPPLSPDSAAALAARNQTTGPHRCDKINPSTGKPCNTVFSRPYDLTRHEDTIHGQRMKVRCQYCTEEKTFSRNDALTRHMRVVHPNVEFAGKHGRRRTGGPLEG